jgi:hypothetical protein
MKKYVRGVSVASDVDIAWAAGLFDGEGSTSVLKAQRDRYAYVRMNVPQKHREVLDKFLSIVNVGKIYKAKTRDIHSLDIYKQEDVELTLNLLWPYLSEIKKKQALAAYERKDQHNGSLP